MMRRILPAAVLLLAACTSSATQPESASQASRPHVSTSRSAHNRSSTTASSTTASSSSPSAPPTTTDAVPAGSLAQRIFNRMSLRQRVGQLLMVDCPTTGVTGATIDAITQRQVGSVILDGTSTAGMQPIQAITGQLQRLAPGSVGLFISTDQEGGLVQRLRGPGFSSIPSALVQGGYPPSALRDDARQWGRQLRRAGVNVNLAPVLDTVPAHFGSNPPIGDLDREYGHTPSRPATQGVAYAEGMDDVGVDATVKHFPGLGRVHGNTDTTSGVTDTITTRHDAYLLPFHAAITQAHVPFVMISSAIYSRIDPGVPAAFSRRIVTGMLRGDLGFRGVIISDDLGAAVQVSGTSVGARAVRFVAAGGDVVLTVNPAATGPMIAALLAKARQDSAFKALVDAAALRVLKAKQARGLLH